MRRVLIVDDDPLFAETVAERLDSAGYATAVASTVEALRALLTPSSDAPHVVLMDVRLGGPGGPQTEGVDLVPEVLAHWPTTRVLVISGFLTADLVRAAFASGAVEVLRKDDLFAELLRPKVRRAADEAERDRTADPARRESELRDAWATCQAETHRQRKGEALERVMKLLLASIRGLIATQRVMNGEEELDVVVANNSPAPFLQSQGPVWIVECKNWSTPSGVAAIHPLVQKMRHRNGRCRLGLLVSMNGFGVTVNEELKRDASTDLLVVCVDRVDLDAWIASDDREAWLVDRITAASCA